MDEIFKEALEDLDSIPPQVELNKEKIWNRIEVKLEANKQAGFIFDKRWLLLFGLLFFSATLWFVKSTREKKQGKKTIIKASKIGRNQSIGVDSIVSDETSIYTPSRISLTQSKRSIQNNSIQLLPIMDSSIVEEKSDEELPHVVHIADMYNEERIRKHTISDASNFTAVKDRKFYLKPFLNVESFNHYFDRERSYMEVVPKEAADFYTTVNPDTVKNGKVIYYYSTGEVYEIDVYEKYNLVSRKKFYKDGKKMLVEKSFSQQSEWVVAGNLPRGTFSAHSNGVYKRSSGSDIEYSSTNNFYSEVIFVGDSNGTKLVKGGNGLYVEYYPNGKIMLSGEYKKGIPAGKWTGYYENGNTMYEAYYNPAFVWIVENIYDSNGNAMVKDGQGTCILYYSNGQIQFSGNYKEGKLSGIVESYYSNGQIKSKSYYEGAWLTGLYTSYHKNGQPFSMGYFRRHNKTGEWNWYDCEGNKINTIIYK